MFLLKEGSYVISISHVAIWIAYKQMNLYPHVPETIWDKASFFPIVMRFLREKNQELFLGEAGTI